MLIEILVKVEVEKTQGAFRSREAIGEAIVEELSDPGQLDVEDSEYEITSWEPEVLEAPKRQRRRRA